MQIYPVDSAIPPLNKRGRGNRPPKITLIYDKKKGVGCIRLVNLDLEFKIRISDLQSNAKSKTDFNAEISVSGF